jgi:hypothetical protein
MSKETWIIIGVLGIVVFAIYKLSPRTSQTIETLVPVGSVDKAPNEDNAVLRSAQVSAFESLVGLGKTQTESTTALSLEDIRGKAMSESLRYQSETALSLAEIESGLQEYLASLQSETALGLGSQNLQLGLYQTDAQLEGLRIYGANRMAEITQQIEAIQNAGLTYRNQSLERQGTILNALLSAGSRQPVYDYQNAFGGTRQTASDIINSIGNAVGKVFKFGF